MKKTILITGSTDGIGKLAATMLAKEGHEIILHGRNAKKLSKVEEEIKTIANNQQIKSFVADFSDLAEVKTMANEVIASIPKLDILINNAGIFKSSVPDNKDGLDIRMVVNYLAPYVLTNALLPLLEQGSDPLILNLGSAAQAPVSAGILLGKEKSSERDTYAQSKLAITMWSFKLAEELPNIRVIPVNPGSLLHTKMALEAFGNYWDSADKGARILFELSLAEQYRGITGKYYDNDRGSFGTAHPDAYDQEKISQLLSMTEEMLK